MICLVCCVGWVMVCVMCEYSVLLFDEVVMVRLVGYVGVVIDDGLVGYLYGLLGVGKSVFVCVLL